MRLHLVAAAAAAASLGGCLFLSLTHISLHRINQRYEILLILSALHIKLKLLRDCKTSFELPEPTSDLLPCFFATRLRLYTYKLS
jgi:hypothetical protein